MSIYEHLEALKTWHQKHHSPTADNFLAPLKRPEIDTLLQRFPYPVPGSLINLYRWHNGLANNAPLFREYTIYPLEEAIEEYALACEESELDEAGQPVWKESWLPILGFMGEHLAIDCDPQAMRTGHIWYKAPGEAAYPWYDSLEQMLLTLRSCFEQGAYFFDEDEILSEDWEAANRIREQLNPFSARVEVETPEPIDQKLEAQPDGTQKLSTYYSESDYTEQFYGPDRKKTGLCEYSGGQLIRRESWHYLSEEEVEITEEHLMGMMMVSKIRGRITPEGRVEALDVQHFFNGEPLSWPEADEEEAETQTPTMPAG
ncbi:MAG: SMI1/KNR4 family protein [Candidatus Sericytochromatia bacterium]|nr:SMI1/KNR4 family protein [Candidatus Sericytochromatia bacterium]